MTNLLTILIIVAIIYWIKTIISRKQKELIEKELRHREQFIKETKFLLDSPMTVPEDTPKTVSEPPKNNDFLLQSIEHFKSLGYTLTESTKVHGIDLIGIKENELALIGYESTKKEITVGDLKEFVADCTVYTDTHPMLKNKEIRRYYATNRAVSEEGHAFLRNHPSTLRLVEL